MSKKSSRKARILLGTYITAALLGLSAFDLARSADLQDASRSAVYGASRSFEETVTAVDRLSQALAKSVYATDGSMCARVCSEACAQALAAETALSTLPFATQELEQISAFLNVAGDYSYTLCAKAAEEGFSPEELEVLRDMSSTAAEMARELRQLQGDVHLGAVVMDEKRLRMQNIHQRQEAMKLSEKLLEYESAFQPLAALEYDGKYGCLPRESRGYLTESAMLKAAADYAGVPTAALREAYAYNDSSGRRCYRAEDLYICVGRAGVESMGQSRLVGETLIGMDEAQHRAEQFLAEHGYRDLELSGSEESGNLASFVFCRLEGEALCLDDRVQIAIALDDGSVYSFNAADFCGEPSGLRFAVSEERARQALPEGLRLEASRPVILKSPGKRDLACYAFSCRDEDEQEVLIYVDAQSGKQCKIQLQDAPAPRAEESVQQED